VHSEEASSGSVVVPFIVKWFAFNDVVLRFFLSASAGGTRGEMQLPMMLDAKESALIASRSPPRSTLVIGRSGTPRPSTHPLAHRLLTQMDE
jgi:hypothetical protein